MAFAVTAKLALVLSCLPAVLPVIAQDAPLPFAAEVRYHFREKFRTAKPGEKRFSAPFNVREALPMSRSTSSDDAAVRIVEGSVAHLPYHFVVKISRSGETSAEMLTVNVVDSSGKPLPGFPQVIPNSLTKADDLSRKEFEIPVSDTIKTDIERTLLKKDQFLTHVDLIVGVDDDFLSANFPKGR